MLGYPGSDKILREIRELNSYSFIYNAVIMEVLTFRE